MSTIPMTACEWRLGDPGLEEVRIEERAQRDGSVLYAVTWLSYVATKDSTWELEPIPSSRTVESEGYVLWSRDARAALEGGEQE